MFLANNAAPVLLQEPDQQTDMRVLAGLLSQDLNQNIAA